MTNKHALLVGICGRTGSGKSTLAARLKGEVERAGLTCGVLSMDDFYFTLDVEQSRCAKHNEYDFDCLEAFNVAKLRSTLEAARRRDVFAFAPYSHATYAHATTRACGPFDVVIVEGLYLFADTSLIQCLDLRLFIDVDADESLMRRIRRDLHTRTDSMTHILAQYERYVRPAYQRLVKPSKQHAHMLIRDGAHNEPAFQSVLCYIRAQCGLPLF